MLILHQNSRESATALSIRCMNVSHLLGKLCGGVEQHVLQEMSQPGQLCRIAEAADANLGAQGLRDCDGS